MFARGGSCVAFVPSSSFDGKSLAFAKRIGAPKLFVSLCDHSPIGLLSEVLLKPTFSTPTRIGKFTFREEFKKIRLDYYYFHLTKPCEAFTAQLIIWHHSRTLTSLVIELSGLHNRKVSIFRIVKNLETSARRFRGVEFFTIAICCPTARDANSNKSIRSSVDESYFLSSWSFVLIAVVNYARTSVQSRI